MDVRKELKSQAEYALLMQEKKIKELEAELKVEKENLLKIKEQVDCDHPSFKTDFAIMGGLDINTCIKCGIQWTY